MKASKEEHYAYRVRDRLRKEVLVPLRKVAWGCLSVYIGANSWDSIPYNRVAKYILHHSQALGKLAIANPIEWGPKELYHNHATLVCNHGV
ncbi:hypothetical protein SLEP1_g14028 [Rubroshorea leprosula]|uniref:DUF2828 domain-containing protein n=1 Tax=Rubroshorea leprosula TaxID=152421 RepID=A0AAV5IM77_9ROSI|nr:hypothetical protein SLEP1_g14028 [Rubroshorea leprosula]